MEKYLRNRIVKLTFSENIEPQEVLLDKLAKRKEEEFGISEKKFETPLVKKIIQALGVSIAVILFLLFAKTFQLQIIEGKNFSELAEENKFIINKIQAERGIIYDNKLKQLAFNVPSFDLIYNKNNSADETSREEAINEVSEILRVPIEDLKKKISESRDSLFSVAQNLDHQNLIILEAKISRLPGFEIKNNAIRSYVEGPIFSQILGYYRKSGEKSGLEDFYNDVLAEKSGEIGIETDAKGKTVSQKIISLPEPGKNLVLWLDSELQKKTNEVLKNNLSRIGARAASAVALDPKTGGVLVMASLPSYDNNLFSQGMSKKEWEDLISNPLKPLFNRAISGQYPTGSTIKPLLASAALEENLISPEKEIYAGGFIEVPHRYDPEIVYKFNDWKVHGWVDMRKALAVSSNVYFYTIGGGYKDQKGLGPSKIKKYLELYGWGEKTGVDLPGENRGFLPSPEWKEQTKKEKWWDGDTYHLSIGQGDILVSPIQEAMAFSAIANGGKLLEPQIVKTVADEQKQPRIVRENFIDSQSLQIVREGMREAVILPEASSHILNSLPVAVAAKTGTAETGKEGYYHTWITVIAPYDDPQIVLTIMIENVKSLSQLTVLPAAKEILEWYFSQNQAN